MGRKFTRKMKGGDLNIDNVKTTIGQLKDDVIRISNDIEKLGQDLELNVVPEVVTEEVKPEIQQSELQDKAKQVEDEVKQELINYAKIMKEVGDKNNAITKDAKELLLENMKTNKDLLEKEGITQEWLNSIPTMEDINLYEDLKNDIKNKITSIEAYLKQYCFTDGIFKKNERVCQNKDDTITVFENRLNKNVSNNNIDGLKDLQSNILGYIAKNKLKVQGGRKTKKNQRKSRKHNKSRK
jgi:hypothetical protein